MKCPKCSKKDCKCPERKEAERKAKKAKLASKSKVEKKTVFFASSTNIGKTKVGSGTDKTKTDKIKTDKIKTDKTKTEKTKTSSIFSTKPKTVQTSAIPSDTKASAKFSSFKTCNYKTPTCVSFKESDYKVTGMAGSIGKSEKGSQSYILRTNSDYANSDKTKGTTGSPGDTKSAKVSRIASERWPDSGSGTKTDTSSKCSSSEAPKGPGISNISNRSSKPTSINQGSKSGTSTKRSLSTAPKGSSRSNISNENGKPTSIGQNEKSGRSTKCPSSETPKGSGTSSILNGSGKPALINQSGKSGTSTKRSSSTALKGSGISGGITGILKKSGRPTSTGQSSKPSSMKPGSYNSQVEQLKSEPARLGDFMPTGANISIPQTGKSKASGSGRGISENINGSGKPGSSRTQSNYPLGSHASPSRVSGQPSGTRTTRTGASVYDFDERNDVGASRVPTVMTTLKTINDKTMASRQTAINTMRGSERMKQERWAQSQLRQNGGSSCACGFIWIRIPDGYKCWAGGHEVTDKLLEEGRGGWYEADMLHATMGRIGPHYGPDPRFADMTPAQLASERRRQFGPMNLTEYNCRWLPEVRAMEKHQRSMESLAQRARKERGIA
ncbi:uncharacterized protein PAC_00347 [Phialocephala subalpina]|uniref:Uncharacterized protein n=1 Tax=Phialocephala subalpina TaxID=576137 RepID=A0A1L7WCG5_9HELO|nr:uncharacterized protein PAC_00347 [Phialocephala subalpina]